MKPVESKDIRKWLEVQGQKVILDMLMAQVASDGRLFATERHIHQ